MKYLNDLKDGDYVVCIDHFAPKDCLTYGKVYKVLAYDTLHKFIWFFDDIGDYDFYNIARFERLSTYRADKIDEILE